MATRSPQSQALHDGFVSHVLPVLAPLGFVRVDVPPDQRAVGWTTLLAECTLPSGGRVRAELACTGTAPPRFQLTGPTCPIELACTERDPAYPNGTTVSHAMSYFEVQGDRRDPMQLAARRRVALEFLAVELAATASQLVAAVPELGPRVDTARTTMAWLDAARRAHTLWINRNVRSAVEDRPTGGTFTFVGAGLAVVEAEGRRFTFKFDTSKIDRSKSPVVSGWWTTPAGTRQPSQLVVGDVKLRFDPSGRLSST